MNKFCFSVNGLGIINYINNSYLCRIYDTKTTRQREKKRKNRKNPRSIGENLTSKR